jgi:DUF1680 family protein
MKNLIKIFSILMVSAFPATINAQSHYQGQHEGKFAIKDKLTPAVYSFDLSDVKLLDSRFTQNMEREEKWLLSISNKQLLHSFRTNAGIFDANEGGYFDIKKLSGWESLDCELRGHTTGHILSGLALLYASTGDQRYKLKADSLVSGLAEVQKTLNQGGYLSAYPQELINRNLEGKKVWAPWYTLHKIYSGLIDQYLYCDNKQALEILKGVSGWAYQKLKPLSETQRTVMLRNEFGGINETFYNLYAITGDPKDKWLAEYFYHNEMLDPLKEGKDILDKKHANTYIPKLIGLTRKYEIDGTDGGDAIPSFFWKTVVEHHSFATGSNSDKEKFFSPDHQSEHLTGYTAESCNVYNMLKLTKHLFSHSCDIKYADYYEKALYNHILGQQDPKTGMIAYFLPMMAGTHKVYSTPDSSFWCCVGSGFENQAKYGESIYYHGEKDLYINLFIPSILNWKEKGLVLKQETVFPQDGKTNLSILQAPSSSIELKLRYPSWATGGAFVKVNGKKIAISQKAGSYISINRKWEKGDLIEVDYPMNLSVIATNDAPDKVAIAYGPIVMAGELGTDGMTGRAPYSNPNLYNDYYTYNYKVPKNINTHLNLNKSKLENAIKPIDYEPLSFMIVNEKIKLRPLYDIHRERYNVYWDINQKATTDQK